MSDRSGKPEKLGLFDSLYQEMSVRLSKGLFEQVVHAPSLKPSLSTSTILAFGLAVVVYLVLLPLFLFGVVLLVGVPSNPFLIVGALVCFYMVWYLLPRLPKLNGKILARQEYPALYRIADRVAGALDAKPLDGIVADGSFNAAYSVVGWRRKRIVYVGLPLLYALDGQERVAMLAHELAHGINGDPARGFFLGTAVEMLLRWYDLLTPGRLAPWRAGGLIDLIVKLASVLAVQFMRLISLIPRFGAWAMVHLYWRDSQRAEYLADYLATTVSGTDPMLSLQAKLRKGGDAMIGIIRQGAVGGGKIDLFGQLRQQLEGCSVPGPQQLSQRDWQEARVDVTHPPTGLRIAFLQARRASGAKLVISPSEWDQVDQELKPFQKDIQEKWIDRYKASLYY